MSSFVLGGDANTGSAGYFCLETELMGWESDFHAAMLAAFAFCRLVGFALVLRSGLPWRSDAFPWWRECFLCRDARCIRLCRVYGLALVLRSGQPSCSYCAFRGVCEHQLNWLCCLETELVDGETGFFVGMPAALAFAASMGWPSCFAVDSPAVLSLRFQEMCFALLRFQDFSVVFMCLLRCCFGLRFQMAAVGMLAAMSTLWSFVWGCDADCFFGGGEHSALHFVRDVAGSVLC